MGMLTTLNLAYLRLNDERGREPKMEVLAFYDLSGCMTYHHFFCMLLVTQSKASTVWEGIAHGCEYQGYEATGSRSGDWLSYVHKGNSIHKVIRTVPDKTETLNKCYLFLS